MIRRPNFPSPGGIGLAVLGPSAAITDGVQLTGFNMVYFSN
jgi:hypothetical protein